MIRAFLVLLTWCLGAALPAGATPPNIVLIVAEDLSPRIGAFGDPVARTPHIDALAAEGVRYPNTFTTAGVCAPSRAALITGMQQMSIGAQHMRTSTAPGARYRTVPPPHVKAFPEHLRASGYHTSVNQKLDYQFSGVLAGSGPFTIWDDEGVPTGWRARPARAPFFAMFNLSETHESGVFEPLGSWPRSATHFVLQLVRAWEFGLDDGEGSTQPSDVLLPPYYPDTPTVRADLARHYNNIERMDARVGQILAQLEADGLMETTIVIWTTDHGDGLPRAKRELYDSGIRVPMIIRWPSANQPEEVIAGSTDRRLVSFVDLAPTILSLAGVPVPETLEGRDLMDAAKPARRYIYAGRDRIDEVLDRQRAVRDDRFKYIRSWHPNVPGGHPLAFRDNIEMVRELHSLNQRQELNPIQGRWFAGPGREQLYDLTEDPHEVRDLVEEGTHTAELERLRSVLDDWLGRTKDWSEDSEDSMADRFWPGGNQPVTPAPTVTRAADRIQIQSSVPGASIGYRVGEGRWKLYTGPISSPDDEEVEARAVRYGWSASETASSTPE
jgi:arylsulfatase A-like enzyme